MLARMNANMKTMQEKADTNRKANRENLKEMMKASPRKDGGQYKSNARTDGEADRFSTLRQRRVETRNKS
jgi:hypothetical protein